MMMVNEFKILVERPDQFKSGQFKTLFRQTLRFDTGVVIPFNKLYDGLKLLFPYEDAIIHFIG